MIIRFSTNVFDQIAGVIWNSRWGISAYTLIAVIAATQQHLHELYGIWMPRLPIVPVTILGGALAIFLGFRNNSAYDRWWEARKVWGAIVNDSRSWAMYVLNFTPTNNGSPTALQQRLIRRQIAWLYVLISQLRNYNCQEQEIQYLEPADLQHLDGKSNKCTHLLNLQGRDLKQALDAGQLDSFHHVEMARIIREFYAYQGMCERIKKTVFPYYYNYFTRIFLWIFITLLPFSLVEQMGFGTIPMTVAISFVFFILEKSGAVTEDPFENRAADTPMLTITRNIEIDLLQMLGETDVPAPLAPAKARFNVLYAK